MRLRIQELETVVSEQQKSNTAFRSEVTIRLAQIVQQLERLATPGL